MKLLVEKWRLIRLKGTELVADGLTKQLMGQSFERFCHAKAKAMSNSTATEDVDLTAVWTVCIILMILGAIYAMQLMAKGATCCLKRLWRASGSQFECNVSERASTSIEPEEGMWPALVMFVLKNCEDEFSGM